MSEIKISALPPASSANPSDIFPIVQGGVTKQLPISAILSSAKDNSVSHLKALPATPRRVLFIALSVSIQAQHLAAVFSYLTQMVPTHK